MPALSRVVSRRSPHKKQAPESENDNEVLTVRQWAALNGFSLSTAERILRGPKSDRPIITQLSTRRRGITRGNNRRWQDGQGR
jgi:hypothetical protein